MAARAEGRAPGVRPTVKQLVWTLILGALVGLAAFGAALLTLAFGSVSGDDLFRAALVHLLLGAVAAPLLWGLSWLFRARGRLRFTLALALLLLVAFAFVTWNVRDRCDVMLIVSDATRADHLSLYGYEKETTPRLDTIADECVIWEEMMAVGSSTIVSTPTILTSLYPTQHGLTGYLQVLGDSVRAIAHHLRDAGYATYGHTTNPHLKTRQGFARGFDLYDEKGGWNTDANLVFGKFMPWYLARRAAQPIFAFLFLIDPHSPYSPPPAFQKMFDPDWEGLPVSSAAGLRFARQEHEIDEGVKRNLTAQYDGEIAFFDQCFGEFIQALRNLGTLDETLIVYTSDHGEEFFDHGRTGHNKTLYEEAIWVPFVVHFPSPLRIPRVGPRGVRVPGLAGHIDILPTVLHFLHLPTDEVPNGRSLLPMIGEKEEDPEAWVFCEQILGTSGPYELYAVRTPEWKYIRTVIFERTAGGPDELYRLVDDPGEQTDVSARYPAKSGELAEQLESMLAVLKLGAPDSLKEVPLDEETRQSLKSLGYIK